MEKTKKGDFLEIKYSGYANGELFDSNILEDVKKLNEKAEAREMIVKVGQGMVIKGLDNALEDKEIGKDYEVNIAKEEGFGERKKELVRTIPLSVFREQRISPVRGMVLALNGMAVKVLAVSGGRVSVDFNHPLAGKELKYKFNIMKKVEDSETKAKACAGFLFGFMPKYEFKDDKFIIKGAKILEEFVKINKEKFKEMSGVELCFEEEKKTEQKA